MPPPALPMSWPSAVLTIAVTLLVILLPGLLVGVAAGLRGWLLAAAAPLLTYAVAGLTGPWLAEAGLPFNAWTFVTATGVIVAVAWFVRRVSRGERRFPGAQRRESAVHDTAGPRELPRWQPAAQAVVVGCVLVGAVAGGYAVLHGMGRLNAIPQDWDAAFHANGIRLITESGDGGLYALSELNKYGDGLALYYPNGYHLLGSLVHQPTGSPIPAILNANTVLLPGLLALSLAALVRAFRGRAVLAGAVALVAVTPATLLYASISRGPLLPFLLGLSLLPLGAVALHRFLQRKDLDTGFLLLLCAVGLLVIHPSTLLAGVLFALPMLLQRWAAPGARARRIGTDLAALAAVAVPCAAVAMLQLYGALFRPAEGGPMQWPVMHDLRSAVGALVTFQHDEPQPQLWLTAALVLGVAFAARLGGLRWLLGTAVLFGVMWLFVATSDSDTVVDWSQPWWNDPWRFIAMASLPLTVIAANGLAETQAWLRDRLPGALRRRSAPVAAGAVVLGVFAAGTQLLNAGQNAAVVSTGYGGEEIRVSADEARAMQRLGQLAAPGEWAMNDRFDGTVWTYAIGGVRTVAAHYDEEQLAGDAYLLGERFRDYRGDPAVRAAVQRLRVRWVIVGKSGFMRDKYRSRGLAGYAHLPFLHKVYENRGAAIYRVSSSMPAGRPSPAAPPNPR